MYFGNAKRYQDLCEEVAAYSRREAVELFYRKFLFENYFPEYHDTLGSNIYDFEGNIIAYEDENVIKYDGGYFYAELNDLKK
jgi:hypothetical protein